ncbi:MAG: AAA family ATPase [Methanomassiliicoccales archaeon]|jgi:cell division protease FtsH
MEKVSLNSSEIISRIHRRQTELKLASQELKRHFVGLDDIIDKIIKNIETWYVMPELLTRPVIICLWGPTGVGKTDLVRRLVKLIRFSDRFCEIEMSCRGSNLDRSYHGGTISGLLSQNTNFKSGEASVVLLDEIQSFRTVDSDGSEMNDYKLRDVWTLLSDGKLPYRVDIEYLLQLLWDYTKKEQDFLRKKAGVKPIQKNKSKLSDAIPSKAPKKITLDELKNELKMGIQTEEKDEDEDGDEDEEAWGYYSLNTFKNALRLKESIEEIALWSDADKKAMILKKINEPETYEEEDFTRSLIFISGNLDEAYNFAKSAQEVDVDADIFHEMSLRISILDIKEALTKRFKPEQIARFGNSHIIYPSLSKKSYQQIIRRKVSEIRHKVKENFDISIIVDKSINNLIYKNGVFPTQGTRPVFSTISEILESLLPQFLLKAFMYKSKVVRLTYENNFIVGRIDKHVVKIHYLGTLDKLKSDKNKNINRKVSTAVHEAGHAVMYAALFKVAPPQIVATAASQQIEGFIYKHEICGAKKMIESIICVMLAGAEAERMTFGENNRSWGMETDLRNATQYAGKMVRRFAMDSVASYIEESQANILANNDCDGTNIHIESIIQKMGVETARILRDHIELFMVVVDYLIIHERISPEDFQKMCQQQGLIIDVKTSDRELYVDYEEQYMKFKEKKNG